MSNVNREENNSIVITAMAAVTAVGGNVEQSTAAINAGITPFVEHCYYECTPDDPEWDEDLPAYVAAVPFIEFHIDNHERFSQLIIPALKELFAQSNIKRQELAATGLLVALPAPDSGVQKLPIDDQWLAKILRQMGLVGLKNARTNRDAHVGVFTLVNEAMALLQSGQLEQCIVGGVDSYLLQSRMAHFDKLWRLKSSRNVDGFIPGEAATMLMLETQEHALARGAEVLASIDGVGFGVEPNNYDSEKASSGKGLTDAIRATLIDVSSNTNIGVIGCDFNGESYASQELGLISTRLGDRFDANTEISHPADCCGDVGAASGGLLMVSAVERIRQSDTENILLTTANDDGRRSALLIKSV